MAPKTSILLPTYNGARFLPEQLESISRQTDPDFELLAIDDGSSDDTITVLNQYARTESRMSVVPSHGNLGQNARIAELLSHARGRYVAISDQDDCWANDRNARLLADIDDCDMAFGRSELIDANGAMVGSSLLELSKTEFRQSERLCALLQPMFSAHATITRFSAISTEALWNPLPFDWLMAVEALYTNGLKYCDEAIVFHRIHGGNQVNNIAIASGNWWPSKSQIRKILLFRRPDRIRLWLMFDYLGRSRRIPPQTRKVFRDLAVGSYALWFSEGRALKASYAALAHRIITQLTPFAGSASDLSRFSERIHVLTRPLLSRTMMHEIRHRARSRRFV